jgi:20S proteasome alpha/beta subunit
VVMISSGVISVRMDMLGLSGSTACSATASRANSCRRYLKKFYCRQRLASNDARRAFSLVTAFNAAWLVK